MDKKAILQVLPNLNSGGVERGTIEIATALQQSKDFIPFVASNHGIMVNELRDKEITHIDLPLYSKNPFTIRKNAKRLVNFIRKYDVKLIHARSRAPAFSARWAANKCNIPFVTTFHGHYSTGKIKNFYNASMIRADLIIAISNFIKQHIINTYRVNPAKITIIHRGVDLNVFNLKRIKQTKIIDLKKKYNLNDKYKIITLIGRISSWKGHSLLIQALKELNNPNIYCLFVGNSNTKYADIAKDIARKNNIKLLLCEEQKKDLIYFYAMSDIIVSASTRPEAFGRVVVEACAMEKLIIAPDHGGAKEIITNNINGFLFKNNNITSLASTIKRVLNLKYHDKEIIISNAKKNIENNFSIELMQQKTLQIYRKLLQM